MASKYMILLIGVIIGLVAGLIRGKVNINQYQPRQLRSWWLVLIAFLPQFLVFIFPATRGYFNDSFARIALISSQTLLLVFVLRNLKVPGMIIMGLGLLLNLSVIILNGGLMPVSPETIHKLVPDYTVSPDLYGQRLGYEKEVILPISSTKLWFLSDRFTLPEFFHYPVAFSLGDILIAFGAFWYLFNPDTNCEVKNETIINLQS